MTDKINQNHRLLMLVFSSVMCGGILSWLIIGFGNIGIFNWLLSIVGLFFCLIIIFTVQKTIRQATAVVDDNDREKKVSEHLNLNDLSIKNATQSEEVKVHDENSDASKIITDENTGYGKHQLLENIFDTYGKTQKMMEEHLKIVTDDTNKAASELIDEFISIFDSMQELRDIVLKEKSHSEQYSDTATNTTTDNNEIVDSVQEILDEKLKESENDQMIMESVVKQIHSLSGLTALIHRVSDQTKILAINAKVIAGKSGDSGRQFGVIANEVSELSNESSQASKQIETAITDLITNIEKGFSHKLDGTRQENESNVLTNVKNQLSILATDFNKLVDVHQQTLHQLDINSKEVSNKVQESLTTIQFQDITQQQIEVVIEGLALYKQYLSDIDSDSGDIKEFDIEQFQKLYVISKQYKTHNLVASTVTPDTKSSANPDDEESGDDLTFF